jgi:tryptophan synthase alpha chain
MADKILTHFIAGYPDLETSYRIGLGLIDGGADALEVQFPYSDPTADGPAIQGACQVAIDRGFKVKEGFAFLARLAAARPGTPLYLMSYSGLVFRGGVEHFCTEAKKAGVTGLIIPDLAPGADEGLFGYGRKLGLEVVPVVVPNISAKRLAEVAAEKPAWIYAALRSGITGQETVIGSDTVAFLTTLKATGAKVMAGFGIVNHGQVAEVCRHADRAIIGSEIVRTIDRALAEGRDPAAAVKVKAGELAG